MDAKQQKLSFSDSMQNSSATKKKKKKGGLATLEDGLAISKKLNIILLYNLAVIL